MKTTKMITAIIIGLAITVSAGEAIGQPGGRGRGGQGWGGDPGWGRGMGGEPRMGANLKPVQPDDYWRPGPYYPYGQGPNQNIQGWQGRGPGRSGRRFQGPRGPYCPFGQDPYQNIQRRQGRGPGGFGQGRQGKRPGNIGRDFQGRGLGPYGQGYGRRDMTMQRGPMAGRGGRGPAIQGRGGRGFQRRDMAPQSWGMNNWRGQPGLRGRGGQGPRLQPRQFAPEDWGQTYQPMPPRSRGWAPGSGQGWRQGQAPGPRQGRAPGWGQDWTPNWNLKPQAEKAPDANTPEPPIVENQTNQPQAE